MSNSEKIEYKTSLQKKCITILEDRIYSIRSAMQEAQLAANGEEKSSAGDKYETSRAMNHIEKDMQASRLSASLKELENLLLVNCNKIFNNVQKGSFVQCDRIGTGRDLSLKVGTSRDLSLFIAAGLGKLLFESQTILLVSPHAPIALKLAGKKAGDTFEFNNQKLGIKEVY